MAWRDVEWDAMRRASYGCGACVRIGEARRLRWRGEGAQCAGICAIIYVCETKMTILRESLSYSTSHPSRSASSKPLDSSEVQLEVPEF